MAKRSRGMARRYGSDDDLQEPLRRRTNQHVMLGLRVLRLALASAVISTGIIVGIRASMDWPVVVWPSQASITLMSLMSSLATLLLSTYTFGRMRQPGHILPWLIGMAVWVATVMNSILWLSLSALWRDAIVPAGYHLLLQLSYATLILAFIVVGISLFAGWRHQLVDYRCHAKEYP